MKIILVLFFYLFPFFSLYSQADSSFYFPMKMGDLWQYKEPPPPEDPYITENWIDRDTTFSNGQTYRSFLVDTYGYPDTGTTAYRRQIDSRIYEYFPGQQKEFLVYDFSKSIGDTVSIFPRSSEDTSIVTVLDTGIQNIFAKLRRYMTFYDKEVHATMYWIDQITDGIGITFSQIEPGLQYSLVGAIIDGVRYGNVTSISSTVKEFPNILKLYRNYPNPFNPMTTIHYQLPSARHVTLKVYDMLGCEVATLVDEIKEMGSYTAVFNADKHASGVYIAQLTAQSEEGKSFVQTKKMLLMK